MITWSEIKTYVGYNWWKFTLVSLVVIIVWTVAINEIVTPNENQRLVITTLNIEFDADQLERDGLGYMEGYENQDIQDVFVETMFIDGPEFHEFLSTRSLPGTDLIILPRSSLGEHTASDLFLPLDETMVLDYFGTNLVYYYEGEVLYGIGLSNEMFQTTFSTYVTSETEEEYYVFINGYSRNVGGWNEDSLANEEAALEFILWLVEEE